MSIRQKDMNCETKINLCREIRNILTHNANPDWQRGSGAR